MPFQRLAFTLFVSLVLSIFATNAVAKDTIRVGWTAWSDAEFVTKLAQRILEDRMGYDVELVQTDIAPQYQGLASGSIDVMLMSWQPSTHADYLEKVGQDVINLGVLYTEARLGWVVPTYIPERELSSLEDLKKSRVQNELDETITGIDPGAGLSRLSKQALEDYDLDDYRLQLSSGAGMTAALERAVRRDEWIVVTGWSPHWMFGRWDLRYLEDPKGTLGSYERIHALARTGFYQENLEAASMLARMHIPLKELQAAMFDAQETSYEEAVDKFMDEHADRIDYWVSAEL